MRCKLILDFVGDRGVDGVKGDRGTSGRDGLIGRTGLSGRAGLTGAKGRSGFKGKRGSDGQDGNVGLIGVQGKIIVNLFTRLFIIYIPSSSNLSLQENLVLMVLKVIGVDMEIKVMLELQEYVAIKVVTDVEVGKVWMEVSVVGV